MTIGGIDLGELEIEARPADCHYDVLGQDVLTQFCCHYQFANRTLFLDSTPIADGQEIFIDAGRHVYLDADWARRADTVTAAAVFDTGASITLIDTAFANSHPELVTNFSTTTGTDAVGTTMETPMAWLNGPRILCHSFARSPAAIVDLTEANSRLAKPMDLILGWPLISQADWLIDHANARAKVTAPHHSSAP